MENKTFTVKIEKGSKNNDEIIFKGEGNSDPSALPGDVIFKI